MPVVEPEYETKGFVGSGICIPSGSEVGYIGWAVDKSIHMLDNAFADGLSLISCL